MAIAATFNLQILHGIASLRGHYVQISHSRTPSEDFLTKQTHPFYVSETLINRALRHRMEMFSLQELFCSNKGGT